MPVYRLQTDIYFTRQNCIQIPATETVFNFFLNSEDQWIDRKIDGVLSWVFTGLWTVPVTQVQSHQRE